ncbi:Mor transcription activator family protein [Mesoterricola sediminis]|uniref:Mor transcription activator domain-containing protein n=1 Tax=Mesoterricola sediminis TaxID=2927980 RepID=A0AA48KBV3_9BACT|nr:Mor transcription activator family protein [Mesoterricola sediminis]BDU76281.1 hypothetical protein METESE_12390 [Mesoterricola sediminis]
MGACRELQDESLPGTVEILIDAVADILISLGASPAGARALARHHVDQILRRIGGGKVYLPRGIDYTPDARAARNEAIKSMARQGVAKAAVGRAFRLSRSQIDRILRARRG